jgi:microcystin degradation protein MlrC
MKPKVLIAGLFHETNTFLAQPTSWADFTVVRGDELLRCLGDGSPLDSALTVARDCGWGLIPAVHAHAIPSGVVEDHAFESYWSVLESYARPALAAGIDAIFLILHGAMATQSEPDAEGELLRRLRGLPGGESPLIFGVLDLHANVSARMSALMNAWVAYRRNPHTDAKQAAERAALLLDRALREKAPVRTVWCGIPIVWSPPGTGTADDPMRSLVQFAAKREAFEPRIWAYNVFAGFSFADTEDTGASLSLVTTGPTEWARAELTAGAELAWSLRESGRVAFPSAAEVAARIATQPPLAKPILMVEPSENIGAGGAGDGTAVLRAMLRYRLPRCLVALADPGAVGQARKLRPGDHAVLPLGGWSWAGDEGPVSLDVELISQSDGEFTLEDPHSHLASMSGLHFSMGPTVVLRHGGPDGITLLVTSRKTPPFDLAQFRSQGIDPARFGVIGVKAAVAHRGAYDPIAGASYFVATPGPCDSDPANFPYARLRRPVWPLDHVEAPEFRFS